MYPTLSLYGHLRSAVVQCRLPHLSLQGHKMMRGKLNYLMSWTIDTEVFIITHYSIVLQKMEIDPRKNFLEPDILPKKSTDAMFIISRYCSQTLKLDYLGVSDDPAPIYLRNWLLTMFIYGFFKICFCHCYFAWSNFIS